MRRLVAVAALALTACGPMDVVVAFVPDGGTRPPPGNPCTGNAQCKPFEFCERHDCDDVAGRCVPRPTFGCDTKPAEPVCSCSGVTYLNDCYRRQQGASAAIAGECTAGVTCSAQAPCPEGAWCSRIVPACGVDTTSGRCWWVPSTCPGVGSFHDCSGGACTDLCTAVRLETPHVPCP